MRIHHINCGTDCPVGGAFFDGRSKGLLGRLVCHCLLIETDAHGLVLVDTGYGLQDVREKARRLSASFMAMLNIRLREEETAVRQLRARGFDPADVRHILITHLDFDHAGGLEDFPQATVHVMRRELDSARDPRRGPLGKRRYRPVQFDDVRRWSTYDGSRGEPWFGFDAVRQLDALPPEFLMVPLVGHTWPRRDRDRRPGRLAAARRRGLLLPRRGPPPGPPLHAGPGRLPDHDGSRPQGPLREPGPSAGALPGPLRLICAHDAVELEAAQSGRPL